MKRNRKELDPIFLFYAIGFTFIFLLPVLLWLYLWISSLLSPLAKWIILYLLAMAILVYEYRHTFNHK